ncbi:MAG: hypothetical protein KAH20_14610 [Methylococcales bacterium]|nr:hypothetical protein [Methylococcales bacterium]
MSDIEFDFTKIDSFKFDGHLVLLKNNSSRLQILNPLASLIWQFKKNGLSNLEIAKEISDALDVSIDRALQDITSINTQWALDFSTSFEKKSNQQTQPLSKDLTDWKAKKSIFLSFSEFTVRVNLDSDVIYDKVRCLFPSSEVGAIHFVDIQLSVISNLGLFLIVQDDLVLEQVDTEGYAALMLFQHVVDLVSKHDDWLVILHAGGVSWKGQGIVFPALGGSGKSTLTAALIKHDFNYINDDVIPLLRKTNELLHLPTNLSIKQGSWPILQSLYPELQELSIYGNYEPRVKYLPPPFDNKSLSRVTAKYIILPNYQDGASARIEPLSSISALQAIIEGESLLHLPLNKTDVTALLKWITTLTCHRLTYDKLDSAVNLLHEFCENNYENG